MDGAARQASGKAYQHEAHLIPPGFFKQEPTKEGRCRDKHVSVTELGYLSDRAAYRPAFG